MKSSEQIGDLATALTKAQAAMTNVNKGSRAKIQTKSGGEYAYTYADLADVYDMIRRPLADNGLAILQSPAVAGNRVEVETILVHTSGQWASCTVGMGVANDDPKSIGSAITYARRYGMALIGVVTDDDDDGDAATKPAIQRATVTPPPPTSQAPAEPLPNPANGKTGGSATPTENQPKHDYKNTPRPWGPIMVVDWLQDTAAYLMAHPGQDSSGKYGAALGIMNSLGDHHPILQYVFQVASAKDLTPAQRSAIVRWVGPEKAKDGTGAWIPLAHFEREYLAVFEDAELFYSSASIPAAQPAQ